MYPQSLVATCTVCTILSLFTMIAKTTTVPPPLVNNITTSSSLFKDELVTETAPALEFSIIEDATVRESNMGSPTLSAVSLTNELPPDGAVSVEIQQPTTKMTPRDVPEIRAMIAGPQTTFPFHESNMGLSTVSGVSLIDELIPDGAVGVEIQPPPTTQRLTSTAEDVSEHFLMTAGPPPTFPVHESNTGAPPMTAVPPQTFPVHESNAGPPPMTAVPPPTFPVHESNAGPLPVTAVPPPTFPVHESNAGSPPISEGSLTGGMVPGFPRPTPITNYETTTWEIQTMIAELPPELIAEIERRLRETQTTEQPTVDIRTIVEGIPPDNGSEAPRERIEPMVRFTAEPVPARLSNVFDDINGDKTFDEKVFEIEGSVCNTVCGRGGFPSDIKNPKVNNCQPCYCDQRCVVLHNCCPDVIFYDMTSHDDGLGSECVQTVPTGVNFSDIQEEDLISMITKCPDVVESFVIPEEVKSKCENVNTSDVQQAFPVSAIDTMLTYRNIFCAQCNNVNITDSGNLHKWTSFVKCKGGMKTLLSGYPDNAEIYRRLNSKAEVARTGCTMRYHSTEHGFDKKCDYFKEPIIEHCNTTGKWISYDEQIERACLLQYTSVVFNKYKNMFCYMCNIEESFNLRRLHINIRDSSDQANSGRLSFQALLDFSRTYVEFESNNAAAMKEPICETHQIYDNITCQCRDVMCSEGKQLSLPDKSTCSSAIQSNYLGYRICLQVDLVFNEIGSARDIDQILYSIKGPLEYCCFAPQPFKIYVTAKSWCPGSKTMSVHVEIFDYYIYGMNDFSDYDSRAENLISTFKTYPERWLPNDVHSHVIILDNSCPENIGIQNPQKPCLNDTNVEVSGKETHFPIPGNAGNIEKNVFYVPFRITNLCSYVDVPAEDFQKRDDLFVHKSTQFEIRGGQIDEIDETTLRVCVESYLHLLASVDKSECKGYRRYNTDNDDFDTWTVAGLVSIVSTCLSLICLILTFITYIIFKSLREGSGKNIMTLTVTLFFAQALFEFAIEQYENETTCTVFGISIHYFWLATVFSMNACTVERFYKLCFPLRSRSFFFSEKPVVIASVYSLLSPLIIVGINIFANYEITGEIGYGNTRVCYINELYSRIYAFALPLALLLLTNIILFAITIHTIRRQRIPGQKSSSTRIGIKACVQLSFVTGLTWLLAFLYEFISSDALGYILTALIGLQGVLFFYSIVLNKRVLALYKGWLSSKSKGSSSAKISGSSGNSHTNGKTETANGVCVAKKQSHVYKITFGDKHSDVTRSTSADSGVAIY